MSRAGAAGVVAGAGALVLLLVAAATVPIDIRHSAAYGFSKTIDVDRALAVRGGYVMANYPDFSRVDLDLRSYSTGGRYDLVVHIRPAPGVLPDVRTVRLDVDGGRIPSAKGAFSDPFLTVRFPPIHDSAGSLYYVWVESGPRDREEVLALWSIKSYSRMTGVAMVRTLLDRKGDGGPPVAAVAATTLVTAIILAGCGLLGRLTRDAVSAVVALPAEGSDHWQRQTDDGIQ